MLKTNLRAQAILRKMGFTIENIDEETIKGTLDLKDEYILERRQTLRSDSESFIPFKEIEKTKTEGNLKAQYKKPQKQAIIQRQIKDKELLSQETT